MSAENRAAPLYCPYCAAEDLRPHGDTGGGWACHGCARVFTVRFVGLLGTVLPAGGSGPEVSR